MLNYEWISKTLGLFVSCLFLQAEKWQHCLMLKQHFQAKSPATLFLPWIKSENFRACYYNNQQPSGCWLCSREMGLDIGVSCLFSLYGRGVSLSLREKEREWKKKMGDAWTSDRCNMIQHQLNAFVQGRGLVTLDPPHNSCWKSPEELLQYHQLDDLFRILLICHQSPVMLYAEEGTRSISSASQVSGRNTAILLLDGWTLQLRPWWWLLGRKLSFSL